MLAVVQSVAFLVRGAVESVRGLIDAVPAPAAVSGEGFGWIGHVTHAVSILQQTGSGHTGSGLHPGLGSCVAVAALLLHLAVTAASVGAFVDAQQVLRRVRAWLRPLFLPMTPLRQLPFRQGPSLIEVTVHTPRAHRVGCRRRRRGPPCGTSSTACV
jgi:hypothetical protein